MDPRGPPPLFTISSITTAARYGRPRHSEPQMLTADDSANGRKGNSKGGAHHHHVDVPTHTICPREEEGHDTRRALGAAAYRVHLPVSCLDRAIPPKDLGRPLPPEEGEGQHRNRYRMPRACAGPLANPPQDCPHGSNPHLCTSLSHQIPRWSE